MAQGYSEDWQGTVTVELHYHHVRNLFNMMEQYREIPVSELPDVTAPADFDVLEEIEAEINQAITEQHYDLD